VVPTRISLLEAVKCRNSSYFAWQLPYYLILPWLNIEQHMEEDMEEYMEEELETDGLN
jgi:hypothetical protein